MLLMNTFLLYNPWCGVFLSVKTLGGQGLTNSLRLYESRAEIKATDVMPAFDCALGEIAGDRSKLIHTGIHYLFTIFVNDHE